MTSNEHQIAGPKSRPQKSGAAAALVAAALPLLNRPCASNGLPAAKVSSLSLDARTRRSARIRLTTRAHSFLKTHRDTLDARSEKKGDVTRSRIFPRCRTEKPRSLMHLRQNVHRRPTWNRMKRRKGFPVHTYVFTFVYIYFVYTKHFRESCRCTNANLDERATTAQACICA